jgi:hypothetical protein
MFDKCFICGKILFRRFLYNGEPTHLRCGINDYFNNLEKVERKLSECEKTKKEKVWRPLCFSIDYVSSAKCCIDCEFYERCGQLKEFKKTLQKIEPVEENV